MPIATCTSARPGKRAAGPQHRPGALQADGNDGGTGGCGGFESAQVEAAHAGRRAEGSFVNAGHPAALLIRGHRVVRALEGPGTLPVGFGGAVPQVSEQILRPGDRVLSFTDGVIEEHQPGGELFGEQRLRELAERAGQECAGLQDMVRALSHSLMQARGGRTTDDAALFLMEWRGAPAGAAEA